MMSKPEHIILYNRSEREILIRSLLCFLCMLFLVDNSFAKGDGNDVPKHYFFDSQAGDDNFSGNDENRAWKTLVNLSSVVLKPGDSVLFKRGSQFREKIVIKSSGEPDSYIVLTSYGDEKLSLPVFTNPVHEDNNYGNCIRLEGSFLKVSRLSFEKTAAHPAGNPNKEGFIDMWEMGAVHIGYEAKYCVIDSNEFTDCPAAIRSNGQHVLIKNNYIKDCNRVLKKWNWGPIGIWIGNDYQKIVHNTVINYRAVDPRIKWAEGIGGGADGGAVEIDDARSEKRNIEIAYNYTRDCQGFLEVTYRDVAEAKHYNNFKIHHNISDDYQQFVALWAGRKCMIDQNTIIRRKVNVNDWGVFNIAQNKAFNMIRNNIIVTEKDISIFNNGLRETSHPQSIIKNNLFYAASGKINFGFEGSGEGAIIDDPRFKNYQGGSPDDFVLDKKSPAIVSGKPLGYQKDFWGNRTNRGNVFELGAITCL